MVKQLSSNKMLNLIFLKLQRYIVQHGEDSQYFAIIISRVWGFPDGSVVKNPPAKAGDARDVGWEHPLNKEMTTHSSTLAWEIPWTEEPGWL